MAIEERHAACSDRDERSVEALALIFEGQSPPFEGRTQDRMGEARWFDSAEALLGAGLDYFGVVARKKARPLPGFSKADVAETTNVIWLDFDPPAEIDLDDRDVLIQRAEQNLEWLRAVGLPPSVYVFSGRGSWAYWKLDRQIPQAEAESLMRRLYAEFRGGGSEHDIGRVARLPGSLNAKTGLRAFVMDVQRRYWNPVEFAALLPETDDADLPEGGHVGSGAVAFDPNLQPGGRLR